MWIRRPAGADSLPHFRGYVAGPLLLKGDGRLGDLLRHGYGGLVHRVVPARLDRLVPPEAKKADAVKYPVVFDRVGLLANGPSGTAGLPFI